MKAIQEAVRAYLEKAAGVRTVSDRTRVRGEYPLLAVGVETGGTVLLAGGRLAEHTYTVTVTAASDREREENTALLASLPLHLLRGIPLEQSGEVRILHPLNIAADEDALTFSVELCVPVPPPATHTPEATHTMETLHFGVSRPEN